MLKPAIPIWALLLIASGTALLGVLWTTNLQSSPVSNAVDQVVIRKEDLTKASPGNLPTTQTDTAPFLYDAPIHNGAVCGAMRPRPSRLAPTCDMIKLSSKYSEECNTGGDPVMPLLVTSTGRSGTTFMREALVRLHLEMTHDNTAPKLQGGVGMVSWPNLFSEFYPDAPYPGWAPFVSPGRFKRVLWQTRDPLKSIRSRLTGSTPGGGGYDHAVFWVVPREPDHFGNIDAPHPHGDRVLYSTFNSTLWLTLRHWVSWHEFGYQISDFAYRLEDHNFTQIFEEAHLPEQGFQAPSQAQQERVESKESHKANHRNMKPVMDHPVTWESLYVLDKEMMLRAVRLSLYYGYCVPEKWQKELAKHEAHLPWFRPDLSWLSAATRSRDRWPQRRSKSFEGTYGKYVGGQAQRFFDHPLWDELVNSTAVLDHEVGQSRPANALLGIPFQLQHGHTTLMYAFPKEQRAPFFHWPQK